VTEPSVSQELAQLVAVAEGPVTVANAAAVLGREPREILDAVETLTADGTLADSTAGLTAAGAVPAPGPSRHAYLAGALADLLQSQGGDAGRVGKLLVAAGRPDEAFDRLTGAVLDHGHTRGDAERLHLADAAVAAAAAARIEAGPVEGRLRLARARLLRGVGRSAEAAADLVVAVKRLEGAEKVDALAFSAAIADDRQHPQEAEVWVALAEAAAVMSGEQAKLGSVLTFHGRELSRIGFAEEADAALAKGNALIESHGNAAQRFYGRMNRAWVELDRGEPRRAEADFAELRDRALALEGEASLADKEAYLARALFGQGRAREALASLEAAEARAAGTEAVAPAFIAALARAEGGLQFGRYDDALAGADRALEITTAHLPAWNNVAGYLRARSLAGLGRTEEARAALAEARAATPPGIDGWRWRTRIRELEMELSSGAWPQREAEDLTDELLHSRFYGPAVELMTVRAAREKDPELAALAAALALRIGNPLTAGRAAQAGALWNGPLGPSVAQAVKSVEQHVPAEWMEQWKSEPYVTSAVAVEATPDDADEQLLREQVDAAFAAAGLSGAEVASPAQRRESGLVRRRPVPRRLLTTVAAAIGIVVLAGGVAFAVTQMNQPVTTVPTTQTTAPPALEETLVEVPEGGISGAASYRGNEARTGVLEGSGVKTATGRYWEPAEPGTDFTADMVAFGRLLYISTTDDSLFAINQGNGTVEFSIPAEDEITAPPAIGVIVTGEQSGEPLLVFPTSDGSLFAYSALRAGSNIWEATGIGTVRGAPLIVATSVVVATEEGNIVALDLGSGAEQWRYPAEGVAGEFRGAPASFDGAIYAADRSGSLHVVDLATGQSRCPNPVGLMSSSRVNPIVADGAVFVGLDALPGIQVSDAAGCGAPSTSFATNYPSGEPVLLPPAVNEGVLYLLEGPRLLAVNLDPATFATQNYMWETPFVSDGPITTPPVLANGVLYVGSQNGKVYAVDATTGQGLWGEGFDVGGPVKGAAVVSNGAVFVSTARGQIWAIAGS
jgi:outer membrane protein assembly factor BamB/tetratricopeptide (TPR) repeat protein